MTEHTRITERLERGFVTLNAAVIVALLVVMCVTVGWNVGLRYFTNRSLPWADEVARYAMIWMSFLGAGLALREGAHVALSNLQAALPDAVARGLRALVLLLLVGFFAAMIWIGWDYATRAQFQRSAALRLSMSWVYLAMPVGFALLTVHLLLIARRYLRHGLDRDENEAV
ncbi:MAG: TRAP transporter small permease [Paracoccus sp. (in: a-proteobacteria)]|uniref:TRAP transporter small permease n=1 Tax=Paracoccus sp. TaxID=267 RepID=UPI0026E036FB|nr:TRAP transporter small permease [Paracoccus sp. (in: a-proteobacteria)]MDO5631253.1 TRAP transporter small permease [Paracoccus sp. (in: a-proteobacteria)]